MRAWGRGGCAAVTQIGLAHESDGGCANDDDGDGDSSGGDDGHDSDDGGDTRDGDGHTAIHRRALALVIVGIGIG